MEVRGYVVRHEHLYLIVAVDRLETAFFCGTAGECMDVLGIKQNRQFHSLLVRKTKVWNFFRIERVRI